jgi:hypothetical protein
MCPSAEGRGMAMISSSHGLPASSSTPCAGAGSRATRQHVQQLLQPARKRHSIQSAATSQSEQRAQQLLSKRNVLTAHPAVSCRCQHTLSTACPPMQQKMVDTLLYVHHAWSNAGL